MAMAIATGIPRCRSARDTGAGVMEVPDREETRVIDIEGVDRQAF